MALKTGIKHSSEMRDNRILDIESTELMALSHAWKATLKNHTKELLHVFRKGLKFVNIKDETILKFLKTIKPESLSDQVKSSITFEPGALMAQRRSSVSYNSDGLSPKEISPNPTRSVDLLKQEKSSVSFKPYGLLKQTCSSGRAPEVKDWERLIESYQSNYRLARWFFQTSYYRKLGEYLISEDYEPWTKDSTWRHLGLLNGANEEKKVRHAVSLFMEWGFIEENDGDRYFRVEGCFPYLKKLLEKTT